MPRRFVGPICLTVENFTYLHLSKLYLPSLQEPEKGNEHRLSLGNVIKKIFLNFISQDMFLGHSDNSNIQLFGGIQSQPLHLLSDTWQGEDVFVNRFKDMSETFVPTLSPQPVPPGLHWIFFFAFLFVSLLL